MHFDIYKIYGSVSSFKSISTFIGYLIPRYYLIHSCKNKGVHTFPKVNVIARLEFELTYLEITIQYFSHYTMRTFSPQNLLRYSTK